VKARLLLLNWSKACPCGRLSATKALLLADCCGRYLRDYSSLPAPDAESLMRSRYSAFVLGDAAYLLATWHLDTRPQELQFDAHARWLGLEVRRHQSSGDQAEVEFVARFKTAGAATRLHEISRFVRQDGRWFYLDGEQR
jgi:SEC-C motif-containing protein